MFTVGSLDGVSLELMYIGAGLEGDRNIKKLKKMILQKKLETVDMTWPTTCVADEESEDCEEG